MMQRTELNFIDIYGWLFFPNQLLINAYENFCFEFIQSTKKKLSIESDSTLGR